MASTNLHDRDFHAWTLQQAMLLKQGRLADADIEHIVEELECMGASERRELIHRLAVRAHGALAEMAVSA